jgi:hypothetical protein
LTATSKKYRFESNGKSLKKANPSPSSRLVYSQKPAVKCLVVPSANAGLKAKGGMRFTFPPYNYFPA